MSRKTLLISFALCALVAPARAATIPIVTVEAYHYLPGDVRDGTTLTITQGELLQFLNLDTIGGFHTITSGDTDAHGTPLFDSGVLTAPGSRSEVTGTDKLPPGTYLFYCSSHGASAMSGRLEVTGN
jgi:plastocyanin